MNDPRDPSAAPWALVAALVYTPVALIGAIWIVVMHDRQTLVERLIGPTLVRDGLIGVALGLALVLFGRLLSKTWSQARRLEIGLARILGPVSPRTCIVLALFSGVGEEILFRAAIQPHLGLVLTSMLFGVLHWPMSRELVLWLPLAMVAGFLFGGAFILTGNVVAPTVAHIVVNARNMGHLSAHWQPGGVLHTSEMGADSNNSPTTAG